jgi:hypothetical protein
MADPLIRDLDKWRCTPVMTIGTHRLAAARQRMLAPARNWLGIAITAPDVS